MTFLKSSGRVSFLTLPIAILLIALVGATSSAQTLTTLAGFNGNNGSEPLRGSLTSDANGDLFGTTYSGGAFNEGTVFEIAKTTDGYASTPTTLVSFNYTDGAHPESGLIADANGDLFGTTSSGGAFGSFGTVFEIAKTNSGYASTPTTLVSFDVADGAFPESSLIMDANGNLFGTTLGGGAFGNGTVFEIIKTNSGYASTPTTLASFDGYDGGDPIGGLVADSNGDLFGTTLLGGPTYSGSSTFGDGTVFEITNTATGYDPAPITLVSFDGADGEGPYSGLIINANGDLFGTTGYGGTFGYGTVFEIPNTSSGYVSTPTTLVSFNNSDGAYLEGGLIADANGNLFGTTESAIGLGGTVFEIAKTPNGYASTPTTVIGFEGSYGADPRAGLIADSNGNLFGTTYAGGSSSDGTVFEVTGSGFVPPKIFTGTPGTPNCVGESISSLAQTYGGIAHAAASLGYSSVANLQSAAARYCSQ